MLCSRLDDTRGAFWMGGEGGGIGLRLNMLESVHVFCNYDHCINIGYTCRVNRENVLVL